MEEGVALLLRLVESADVLVAQDPRRHRARDHGGQIDDANNG
jgi:hypothetical protein